MPANAFERGVRAKRKGRLESSNPFARRAGRGNAKKANDWLLGWHSVEYTGPAPGSSGGAFQWPPLEPMPYAPEGDYDRRCRGLEALFLPSDPLEWEVLLAEMRGGTVSWLPHWAKIPYAILWHYAEGRGESLGEAPDYSSLEPWTAHPIKYLYSALQVQGSASRWPPLVVSAYEELVQ